MKFEVLSRCVQFRTKDYQYFKREIWNLLVILE